jgi:hypothetical protein
MLDKHSSNWASFLAFLCLSHFLFLCLSLSLFHTHTHTHTHTHKCHNVSPFPLPVQLLYVNYKKPFLYFIRLRFELRALYLQRRHCTASATP